MQNLKNNLSCLIGFTVLIVKGVKQYGWANISFSECDFGCLTSTAITNARV